MLSYKREVKRQTLIVFCKEVIKGTNEDIPRGYMQISLNSDYLNITSLYYAWTDPDHKGEE